MVSLWFSYAFLMVSPWFPYDSPNIFRDGSAIEVYTTPDPKVEIIAVAFTQLTLPDFAGFDFSDFRRENQVNFSEFGI